MTSDIPECLRKRALSVLLSLGCNDVCKHVALNSCGCFKAIARALHEVEQAARAEAAKIADEYADWTYWGQYDNGSAAEAAAAEIAQAIRLGRPLTSEEIRAVDKGRAGVPKLGGDKTAVYERGRAEGERAGAEAMREAARETLQEVDGCFEAALAEGWADALASGDIERITDLFNRRIVCARTAAVAALTKES